MSDIVCACVRNRPGTYTPVSGLASCTDCVAGNSSSYARDFCYVCPPGTCTLRCVLCSDALCFVCLIFLTYVFFYT